MSNQEVVNSVKQCADELTRRINKTVIITESSHKAGDSITPLCALERLSEALQCLPEEVTATKLATAHP